MTTAHAILTCATVAACALSNAGWDADQSAATARREHVGAEMQPPSLPTALRVQLLESAWATHSIAINDRAVLDRWRVYQHLDRRIDDSHMLFEARVDYAAQGHLERYWMRATPGAARPWSVDSVTLAMFYVY